MTMKFLIIIYTLTISLRGCISQDDQSLDDLIAKTFNTGTEQTSPRSTSSPQDQNIGVSETLEGNGDCECVPYYQCNTNRTFIENGEGLIDIRIKTGPCESYMDVCCGSGATVEEPITPTPPPDTPNPTSSSCGQRNFQGVSSLRITGDLDNEAQFGEFPWMTAVIGKTKVEGRDSPVSMYLCGGSLISRSVVLTAAHCVNNKTELSVRVGEWDTQTKNEPLPMKTIAVRDVVIHEQFHPATLHNDVALLLLETPVDLAPHISTICLPDQGEIMDGRQCVASGWGKNVFGQEGKYQVILKKVEMPTVPRGPCLEALQNTRLGNKFKLHETFMCAGGIKGSDTCKGDGGSPLACPSATDPQVYVQAGIVAWGIGCGTEVPGVYVSVAQFRNWIDNKMKTDPDFLKKKDADKSKTTSNVISNFDHNIV